MNKSGLVLNKDIHFKQFCCVMFNVLAIGFIGLLNDNILKAALASQSLALDRSCIKRVYSRVS
jgi:hypothetical protein